MKVKTAFLNAYHWVRFFGVSRPKAALIAARATLTAWFES